MPELMRLIISDNISQRYARSRLVVYGVAAVCFVLFIILITSVQPSFPMLVASSLSFILGALVCIMRNPLGILTMRAQLKLAAREIIFDPQGLTIVRLSGHGAHFKAPRAEITFLPGPGGADYYLIVRDEENMTGSCYIGNDPDDVARLAKLLEESGSLEKYDRPQESPGANLKGHSGQFFS